MLANSAIQKLERYGQLGLKRENVIKFVESSFKDEKMSNAFALTRAQSWQDAAKGLTRCGQDEEGNEVSYDPFHSSPLVASEMIVFASGFAIALIQAPYNKEYQTGSAPIPSCISSLTHEQVIEVIDAVGSVLNALNASNVAASQRVTEAYGMLLNVLLDFGLALIEGSTNVSNDQRQQLLTSVKQVLFVACSKFRGSYTAFPMTSLLSIRTASAVCKSTISNKKTRLSVMSLPLLVKASVMENRCHDKKHQSHLDWALADNLCRVCAFSLVNRATRTVIYYRGDDIRLAQADVTNHSEYAAHSFVVSAPIDCPYQTSTIAQDMARRWLESLPCLYKAFVSDAGWTLMAREQRRLKIQRDAIRHQERPKKAKQSTLNQLSMDTNSRSSANGDADHLSSRASNLSMGSTIVSIIKAREAGGTNDELLSVLDTVDAETRSVLSSMSHASATSYLSFMSVIDAAGAERDELQRHESADHNTNLALIFFEQIVLAISQLVESMDMAILTSTGLVDVAWKQIEKLFVTLQASLSPVDNALVASMPLAYRRALISLENTPLFQFSHDMRYNGGLGYQTLGILFARIMSPLLDTEAESVPLIPTAAGAARAGTRWSQLRTPQQESALAACLGVYEAVAPQVINMHLKQIVRVVASSLSQADKQADRARMLEVFLSRIMIRLGKSNSALSLLNILLQVAVAAPLDEAQRALHLVRQPLLDRSISQSVEDCMDIESMLAFLGRAVDLLQTEDNDTKTDNEETQTEGPMQHADRATLALQLLSCVGRGLIPTSLTSFIVVDRIAEVDLILSNYVVSIASGTQSKATRKLIADGLRSLFAVRQVMDRCLVDLGASDMEQYLRVLEGSLWQFETSVAQLAGTLTVPDLLAVVEGVSDGASLVSALALQRLTQCHSVVTVLDLMATVRRDLKHLAVFVLEQFAASGPASPAMLQLTQSQWTALSCYGKKALIRTFVPILRHQCVSGLNVEAFLGEWSTAAGDVLDALTVMLLEATPASKELTVLLTAISFLVRGRATVPRLPQVLSALIALFTNLSDSDVNKSAHVADLILLLLQCSRTATLLVVKGAKAPQVDSLRNAYVEYLADPDELVEEAKEAAAQLPKLFFAPVVAKLLLGASGISNAHARLLSLLYGLGGSFDATTSKYVAVFCQTIISELLLLVQCDKLEALAQFLSLQQHSTGSKKRQRQEEGGEAVAVVDAPPFSPITLALFKTLENTTQKGGKKLKQEVLTLRCLRLLVLLGSSSTSVALPKEQCQSLIASSSAFESFASTGADGLIVALALGHVCADEASLAKVSELLVAKLDAAPGAEDDTAQLVHQLIPLLPSVVRSLGSNDALGSTLLHKALRFAVSQVKSNLAVRLSLAQATLRCLLQLSRVSGFRFSSVKSHVKGMLEVLIHEAARNHVALLSVSDIRTMVQILRLPLAQYHGDEVFVDLELSLLQLLPEYLSTAVRSSKGVSASCAEVVKDVFHMLSSTFIDLCVFRHRVHLLGPLISGWFTHVLRGLDSEVYDGSVTGALASFFFRLTRTLHRSLDLSTNQSKEAATDVAALQLGIGTDALLLQQASIIGSMFTLSNKYLSVFARHGPELDFLTADTLKLLHREKLPDIFAHLNKKGEAPRKNLSKSTYADLVFASVGSEEGRNILRQNLMSATDGDAAGSGDASIIFSARERYLQ
jgi:hypothetical protein